jgi:hypothetical protein
VSGLRLRSAHSRHLAKGLVLCAAEITVLAAVTWALKHVAAVYVPTALYVLAILPIAL